jgi:3-phosphoshikimate 1-carboxyvinyltransferase
LIIATKSQGQSYFRHLNQGLDVAATGAALARCGIRCDRQGEEATVRGGAFEDPDGILDFGNSGTGVRLVAGLLAGSGVRARLTGDASLRSRPMDRIVLPLRAMGADVQAEGGRFLPLAISPAALRPLEYTLPVPSAQVKSCLLLAGLAGGVAVRIRESAASRDHTERMLAAMGAAVRREKDEVTLEPSGALRPIHMRVPGDFSGAAFFLGLATLVPEVRLELPGIGVNPGRTGFMDVLVEMGADVRAAPSGDEAGEPVADLSVGYAGRLRGVDIPPEMAPRLIDEVPILAALAATARGKTRISGIGELRVKESNRLRAIAQGLRAVGARVTELEDGLEISGSARPPAGGVETHRDHRIAMAFAVLGRTPGASVRLSETASIATSFPEFPRLLEEVFA